MGKMKKLHSIIIALYWAQLSFGQINQPDTSILNSSGINYFPITKVSNQNAAIGASFCRGILKKHPSNLTEIGISPQISTKDCNCTVGDFDGNGYLDFAFWGIDKSNPIHNGLNNLDYENYLILFFEKAEIVKTELIKTEPGFALVYYPPRHETGPNGEPVSNYDALWICGESNGYDDYSKGTVFIYDLQSSTFKNIEF